MLIAKRSILNMDSCDEFPELEDLLLKHPGLMAQVTNTKGIALQGPVKIKNKWLNIKLVCPNYPDVKCAQIQLQQRYHIKTFTAAKNTDIKKDWTVEDLLENLPLLINNYNDVCIKEESVKAPVVHSNIYNAIVKLYAPSEYEMELNDLCSKVRFSKFYQNEQHYLEVELPSLQLREHSLPACIDWQELLGKSTTLVALLQQFRKCLEDLRPFYDNFTDIDELCYVVQPPLPTTKENWRLFVLKERIFLKLLFADPFSLLGSMSVHIIGPTPEVTHLRRVYSEGLSDWDGELDVHKNLMRIFDLCFFPMPPADGSEASLQYCNICYSYKLEHGEIPIISCDNAQCSLIFHAACLKEWFSTLADGKTFLEVAFGACPFCKAKLSTSFQEILLQ